MSVQAMRTRLAKASLKSGRAPASQAERVYRELRRALLCGELPLTRRLTEEDCAERFRTSRTPVREALRRLQSEGHLVREQGGALRPDAPRVSTMREIYEVRVALEALVVRRACERQPGVDENGLRTLRGDWLGLQEAWPELAEDFELPEFVHADEGFHEALARLSGNITAARHLRDVNERIRLLRIHDFTTEDRIKTTIAEHVAISEAIIAGQTAAAMSRMRKHIELSAAVVEQRVGAALARMLNVEAEAVRE
ncbi:MAG: GntR family transcriptional regulator [Actinobacteria bacterium]|nr:GntR family transcriptional regulator [Actinomycetota bacterium]